MIITWRWSEELDAVFLSCLKSVINLEDAMARLNFWVTRLARNRRNKTAYNTSFINWKLEYVCTSCRSSSFPFKPNRSQYLFWKRIKMEVITCDYLQFYQLKTYYLLSVKLTLVWDFAFSVAFSAILQSKIHIFFFFFALFNIFYLCIRVFIQNMPNKICGKNQALSESVLVAD